MLIWRFTGRCVHFVGTMTPIFILSPYSSVRRCSRVGFFDSSPSGRPRRPSTPAFRNLLGLGDFDGGGRFQLLQLVIVDRAPSRTAARLTATPPRGDYLADCSGRSTRRRGLSFLHGDLRWPRCGTGSLSTSVPVVRLGVQPGGAARS